MMFLTDCSRSAYTSESLHQDDRDDEDGGDESRKEDSFTDFPVKEVAEQLTRLDAVGFKFLLC